MKENIVNAPLRDGNGLLKATSEYGNPNAHQQDICSSYNYKIGAEERGQLKSLNGQVEDEESHRMDMTSVYAIVNKSSKRQNNESSATRANSLAKESQSSEYDRLKQDEPTKAIITKSEGRDQVDNLREKSPSPEYAELSTRVMKVPVITNCLTKEAMQESRNESNSHEYDKAVSAAQASESAKNTSNETEQHYYYTLENPEECCRENKGKEETTNINTAGEIEYSMPQAHSLVIDNTAVVTNTAAKAELVSVREIDESTLDSQQGEASADNI